MRINGTNRQPADSADSPATWAACVSSSLPLKQQTLGEITDQPLLCNEAIVEPARHHVAPHNPTTRRRKTPKNPLVRGTERSLPGDTVSRLEENLDLDMYIRESTPIQKQDTPDRRVSAGQISVREVCHIVRRKKLTNRIEVSILHEHRVCCFNL